MEQRINLVLWVKVSFNHYLYFIFQLLDFQYVYNFIKFVSTYYCIKQIIL